MKYRIADIRKEKGISQSELARKSGITRTTIWRLENNGDKVTTTNTLFKIASALEVPIDELFFENEV